MTPGGAFLPDYRALMMYAAGMGRGAKKLRPSTSMAVSRMRVARLLSSLRPWRLLRAVASPLLGLTLVVKFTSGRFGVLGNIIAGGPIAAIAAPVPCVTVPAPAILGHPGSPSRSLKGIVSRGVTNRPLMLIFSRFARRSRYCRRQTLKGCSTASSNRLTVGALVGARAAAGLPVAETPCLLLRRARLGEAADR